MAQIFDPRSFARPPGSPGHKCPGYKTTPEQSGWEEISPIDRTWFGSPVVYDRAVLDEL
jgi:hypothetical protein